MSYETYTTLLIIACIIMLIITIACIAAACEATSKKDDIEYLALCGAKFTSQERYIHTVGGPHKIEVILAKPPGARDYMDLDDAANWARKPVNKHVLLKAIKPEVEQYEEGSWKDENTSA